MVERRVDKRFQSDKYLIDLSVFFCLLSLMSVYTGDGYQNFHFLGYVNVVYFFFYIFSLSTVERRQLRGVNMILYFDE